MPKLEWENKVDAMCDVNKVSYCLLEAVPELSACDTDTENMLIHGENLDALKALLPYYAGKVKCIFIDPPYNTKSAFEHYDDNLEHTKWLAMMYPRLELLRSFLSEDGSIWVTIDDNEAHYLKVIMDEVFGRKNFVANVVWQKNSSPKNDAKYFSHNHDHIITFAKNKNTLKTNLLPRTEKMNALYKNPDNDPNGVWYATELSAKSGSEKGKSFSYTFRNGYFWTPPLGRYPRFSYERLSRMEDQKEIWFGKDGKSKPRKKTYLSKLLRNGTPPFTMWLSDEVGQNKESKKEVIKLNSIEIFDTPKPERLLKRILEIATNEGDLVLDSFLGSGTTAAVAHKMKRRYIGIEMGNHAETHCQTRLKKVIEGEQGGISKAVGWTGGGGFKYFRLIYAIDTQIMAFK